MTSNLFSVLDMCSKCVFCVSLILLCFPKNKAVLYCLNGASTCKNRNQTVTGKITGIKMYLGFVFDMKLYHDNVFTVAFYVISFFTIRWSVNLFIWAGMLIKSEYDGLISLKVVLSFVFVFVIVVLQKILLLIKFIRFLTLEKNFFSVI